MQDNNCLKDLYISTLDEKAIKKAWENINPVQIAIDSSSNGVDKGCKIKYKIIDGKVNILESEIIE